MFLSNGRIEWFRFVFPFLFCIVVWSISSYYLISFHSIRWFVFFHKIAFELRYKVILQFFIIQSFNVEFSIDLNIRIRKSVNNPSNRRAIGNATRAQFSNAVFLSFFFLIIFKILFSYENSQMILGIFFHHIAITTHYI